MKDFFISYNKADRKWAEWIAWIVEEAGYSTIIQAWDFRSGGNFVLEMMKAGVGTSKTIAVLSDHYLAAEYTQPEWATAFARDPKGNFKILIPVRVSPCEPSGLLSQLIYTDLVGLDEENATRTLLDSLRERGKPVNAPPFPNSPVKEINSATVIPHHDDESEQVISTDVVQSTAAENATLTPNMKLSEFFKQWFLPVILQSQKEVKETTILLYYASIYYWSELTGDPPLNQISEIVTSKFVDDLLKATYKRGPFGPKRTLNPQTAKKHVTAIRSILYRTGPSTDPGRPAMELIKKVPYIKMPVARAKKKDPFPLNFARRIVAASRDMQSPKGLSITPGLFWVAFCAAGFYLGARAGTVLGITRKMVVKINDEWWVDIPQTEDLTEKPMKRRLHPKLIEVWSKIFTLGETSDDLIIEWRHDYRHLIRQHERLQEIAGIADMQSPEVWRRTHDVQMAELGYGLARDWLNRSSETITPNHYTDVTNKFVTQLPDLWDGQLDD